MGFGTTLRALRDDVRTKTGAILATACRSEAARLVRRSAGGPRRDRRSGGRFVRQAVQHGRLTEVQCYLLQQLEQRVIADQGLLAYFFFDQNLTDMAFFQPAGGITDINFDWSSGTPDASVIPAGSGFSARWTGTFTVGTPGNYGFAASFSDGMRLKIDGQTVVGQWPTLAGDADGNGIVDLGDMNAVLNNFGLSPATRLQGDLDGNGSVDLSDLNFVFNTFGQQWGHSYIDEWGEKELSSGSHSFELDFFNHDGPAFLNLSMYIPESPGGGMGSSPTPIGGSVSMPAPVVVGWPTAVAGVEGTAVKIQAYFGKPTSAAVTACVNWNDPGVANKPPTLTYTASHTGKLSASHTYANSGTYAATLTITGPTGTNNYPFTVTVTDAAAAPRATFANAGPAQVGSPATVSFSNVYEPSGTDPAQPVHYSMALSQGGLATTYAAATSAASKQFTFTSPGTHTVYGRVVDRNGKMSVDYQTDITVVDVAAVGDTEAAAGAPYQLSLVAQGAAPEGWTINWDDGSDPDGDGVVGQSIWGSPSSVVHVYASAAPTRTIRATALFDGGSFAAAPFAIAVRPGLVISGPEAAAAGDPLTYTVAGLDPSDPAPIWTVTVDGTQYTTGIGRTLIFAPDRPGNYLVDVVARKGGATLSASTSVAVSSAAMKVSISGPSLAFIGRPVVYSSTLSRPAGAGGSLSYHWRVGDRNGQPLPPDGVGTYFQEGLSTFMTPSTLQPGTYTVLLSVEDGAGGVATTKNQFEVLEDPSEADYERGFVPVTLFGNTTDFPYAVAQQVVDGETKILIAGRARELAGMTPSYRYAAFLARFNSDLTLDTNFGNAGVITDALGGHPGQYFSSTAWALAVDPKTQDIVVTGSVEKEGSARPGLVVARYRPDGKAMDTEFHGGTPLASLPPSWGSWVDDDAEWTLPSDVPAVDWSGVPFDVTVLPDHSILVGGSMTKYWPAEYGGGTYQEDDFLLLKIVGVDQPGEPGQPDLEAGSIDPRFGHGGFAATVNPSNIPDGAAWDDLEEQEAQGGLLGVPGELAHWDAWAGLAGRMLPTNSARITKILPQFDGDGELASILVGGSAYDWANTDQMSLDTGLPAYDGTGWDFVLARYDGDGDVDTAFGDQGKVTTDFGRQTSTYPDGRSFVAQDNFLDNIELLPKEGDPNGYIILAVGSAPSPTLRASGNNGQGNNYPEIPQCLAMAWYTSDGQPDLSFGNYVDATHHSGTLVSSVLVGGSSDPQHFGVIAVTFDAEHRVILSTRVIGRWGGGGGFGYSEPGWTMTRVEPVWSLEADDPVTDPDVRDKSFGSLGDGSVTFSRPQPVRIMPAPSTTEAAGPIASAYGAAAVLSTANGIIAVGGMDYLHVGANPTFTSMVVRYKQATPTPTDLTAVGLGQKAVALTWVPPVEGTWFGYAIERAQATADGTPPVYNVVGYAGQGRTSFTDEDASLEPGTTYLYRVHAVNGKGMVPTFAGPAQASTLPDLSKYGLVETISLDPNGTTVRSGTTLVAGVKYILRASGSFYALGPDGRQYQLDAEYVRDTLLNTQTGTSGTIDVGVALNGNGHVQFYKDLYTVDEQSGTYEATFTVVRTGGLVGDLTFHYQTADGTGADAALDGTDYDEVCGDVTLHQGVSTAVIRVPIRHNPAYGDRRFTLELSDPALPLTDPPLATANVTIGDTDAAPTFDISVDRQRVTAGEAVTVTVTRHGNGHGDRTVHLATSDGTAVSTTTAGHSADGDYDGIDLDVTFAGDGSAVWRRTIVTHDQGATHAGRSFQIALTEGSGTAGALLSQATVTLTNAAIAPVLGFERPSYAFGEAAVLEVVNLTLSTGLAQDLTVPYTIASGGTAAPGVDFTISGLTAATSGGVTTWSGTVTIPAGQTRWPVEVRVTGDRVHELDESFTLTIGAPTGGSVAVGAGSTTVTIADDDRAAVLQWEAGSPEAQSATDADGTLWPRIHRMVNRTGTTTVKVTFVGDTAVAGTNYVDRTDYYTFADDQEYLEIKVPILHEGFAGTKGFDLVLSLPSTEAEISTAPGADHARITISGTPSSPTTTPQTFQIRPDPYRFGESTGTARLWVLREGGDPSQPADVYYSTLAVAGTDTAVAGTDFTAAVAGAFAHFPAGIKKALIEVPVLSNQRADGTRTFRVQLTNSPDGDVDLTTAQVAILDDDPAAVAGFEVVYRYDPATGLSLSNPVSEGNTTYELIVRRSGNAAGPSDVMYEVTGGTAAAGTEYSVVTPGTVHFGPDEKEKSIPITLYDDAATDGLKYINFALTGASGGTLLGANRTVRVNILDTEAKPAAVVSLSPATVYVAEGGDAILTLYRDGDTSHAVTVQWTTSPGSARPLDDYGQRGSATVLGGTATFLAGQTTATIKIPTAPDGRTEGAETFYVALTGAAVADGTTTTTAVLGSSARSSVTITEPGPVWIDKVDYIFGWPEFGIPHSDVPSASMITLRRSGTATEIALPSSVAWTATDQLRQLAFSGVAYFGPGQVTTSFTFSNLTAYSALYESSFGPGELVLRPRGGVQWFEVKTWTLQLENPSSASLGMLSKTSFRLYSPEFTWTPVTVGGDAGSTFAPMSLSVADQSVRFGTKDHGSKVYLTNEGAGEVELEVVRTGGTSGTLTVQYETSDASAISVTAGADYDAVSDGVITFGPGEEKKTIKIRIRPDQVAGGTASTDAEADETFAVTLTSVTASDGLTAAIDTNFSSATVVIASLTDSVKQPAWGEPSAQSDLGYEIAVDAAQADPDGHLVLNYRNGAFTGFTTDADGEHAVTAGPIQVQIWAPLPETVAQLTAVPHWATSPGDRSIGLSWRAPQESGGVGAAQEYYEIERSENGGAFEFLARVAPGTTSYADTTAAQDAAYAYRVTVHAGALDSHPSNTAYAMLANRAPRVEFIGTQLVRPGDADFEYAVVGFDAEDGKNLHYLPLTVVDGNNAPAPGILSIKEDTGVITQHSGWVPAATDIGKSYKVTVHAADQTGQTTDRTFSLAVVARPLSLPDVGAIGAAFSPDGTLATLTSGAPSGMVYRWHFIPAAGGPDATIVDPTAQNPTMTFTKAGDYTVTLKVTRPDAVASSVTVRGTIHVDSLATRVLVTEAPGDVDLTVAMGPARMPADPIPVAVGKSETDQYFMATVYDQFGDKLDSTDSDHVHPNMDWKLRDPFGSVVRESAQAGSTVKMGAQAGQVGRYTLTATASNDSGLTGSIVVSYADVDAPTVEILPDGTTLTGLRLKADNLVYNGTAEQRAGLQYYWSVVGHPEIGFASNGTSAAKETLAIFPHAGTYEAGLHFQLTVVDPRNGLRSAPADYVTPDPVTFVAQATALRVTPARPTVAPGGYVELTATLVDQFGNAMAEQPPTVTWELDALGNLVTPDDNEFPDPTGTKARYRPGTPPPSSSSILGTVRASAGGFSVTIPLNKRDDQAPPTVSLEVATVRDPLATDGGGGVTNLVDRPQAVSAVIVDPAGGTLTWTLTAMPEGAAEGSVPTLLFRGAGPAGALPGVFARIGTLAPTQLPDGTYTLTLTATSDLGDSFVEGSSSQVVQVRSAVKLGNLTLPVTDLTQNVPNDLPVTVSRNYDSQRAGQNGPLGFGWTLDALTPALTSTQTVQYFDQPNPTSTDGTPGTSLAMNDLIYVTFPSGERHAFAFRPLPLIDTSQLGAGLVLGAVTYAPHFVPVDGSGATLEPSDVHGNLRTDETLLWDSADGGYAFRSQDKPLGYNPALKDDFGGYYVMTTVDGTRYVVNAATGRLHTRTDLQNRTQTFDGGADGTVSTTQGSRKYEAAPTTRDSANRITRIVTRVTEGGTTTELQEAIYGYDTHGDLTSVVVKDAVTHAELRSTRYTYVDHRLTGVIDGLGVTVLSAAYDPGTGQLSQLTNTKGVGAKASTGSSGDSAAETVTDPAGNQVYNQYDDHGNVIRTITTVTDPFGKVPQYYVVTVRDYGYGDPTGTDNARNADGSIRYVSGTNFEDYWPTVNVLDHAYTSAPFVVPAARAGDRFLGIDALKARGYLKSDTRGILWASKQEYDPEQRVLASTSVLQGDGSYLVATYGGDAHTYVYGKPSQVISRIEWVGSGKNLPQTTFTYAPATRTDGSGNTSPNPNAGLLATSKDHATNRITTYIYGGDGVPGTGYYNWETGEDTPAPAPDGMLYGTYRDMISDEVTGSSTPLWLTVNHYYGYGENPSFTPATATTPGGLAGKLRATTDGATGVTTIYAYYADGRVATVSKSWTEGVGSETVEHTVTESTTVYDALGRVTQVTGSTGQSTFTTYDTNGQVLDTTDTFGGVTHRVYDASGRLVQILYPDHTETRTVYDGQGRVTWQTDRFVSTTIYNLTTGEVASDDSATANATRTIYDGQGRTIATERHASVQISMAVDPAAPAGTTIYTSSLASAGTKLSVTSTAYDALGRVVQTTDAAGLRTGTIYYDDGRAHYSGVLKEAASDKGTSPWYSIPLPTNDVDHPHRVEEYLSGLFVSYTTSYPDQVYGRPGEPAPPPGAGIPADLGWYAATTDALGRTTRFYRDDLGRPKATLYADGSYDITYYSDPNAHTAISQQNIWNDARDGGTWAISADEGWAWFNESNGEPVLPVGYSEVIKVAQRTGDNNSGEPVQATVYVYDSGGRLTDVWLPYVDDATTPPTTKVRPHWHYTYDANGNQLTQADPKGHTTSFTYDERGRRTSRTLPAVGGDSVTEHWTYDPRGRTRTHTDFNGQTTTYVYDDVPAHGGRLQAEYRYAIGAPAPTFGTDGTLLNPNDASERTDYAYDSMGRQESAADFRNAVPGTSAWQADTSTHYDINSTTGQTDAVRTTIGPADLGTVHYAYDPATGRKVRTWTDANDTSYDYDAQGRLWHVTVTRLNGQDLAAAPQVTTYAYDAVGNLKKVAQPNGLTTTYTYDSLNRLTDEAVTRDDLTTTTVEAVPVMDFHYTLRRDGLRDDVTETRHTADGTGVFSQAFVNYDYDADGRLTDESLTVLAGGSDAPAPYHNRYTFDLAGNRHQKVIDAGYDGVNDETITYTYNERDQLVAEDSDTVDAHDAAYRYDPNGSQTEKVAGPAGGSTTTTRYLWDLRGRMVAVDGNGDGDLSIGANGVTTGSVNDASDTTIAYDTNGVRIAETTVGSPTTYSVNDPNNLTGYTKAVEEKTGTSVAAAIVSRSYVLGLKVEGQSDTVHNTLYMLTDGHGSTRVLVNLSGTAQQRYDYDAFGKLLGTTTDTSWTPWLFGGDGAYDLATGWTYHLARWRSDFRFVSYDSFEANPDSPAHLHKYLYAGNNPLHYIDPRGHDLNLVSLGVAAGIGALLGGITTAGVNYALGREQTFSSIAYGALLGGIAGPLAVAFPVFGAAAAGYGIYQGWNLTWQVWTNPRSTNGQLAASLIIFGGSLFGGYAAGKNLASNGWYNPAFERPPVNNQPGLSPGTPLAELFEGVPDDAMVHISRASLAELEAGVRGSPGTGKSYWLRWGDIKNLSVTQFRGVVGEQAQGGLSDANTFVFKFQNANTVGVFKPGALRLNTFQEYEATENVKPDGGGVVAPNGD